MDQGGNRTAPLCVPFPKTVYKHDGTHKTCVAVAFQLYPAKCHEEMAALRSYLPVWERSGSAVAGATSTALRQITRLIEDYRPGYPRFTALISAYDGYFLCRRFDKLRARLLLQKQDKLSMLEEKLEQVDCEETSPLFLGKNRCDGNAQRIALLSEIDTQLADYDQFIERTSRILHFGPPQPRDVESLQNWLQGTGCLAREETAYLGHRPELVSLAPVGDSAMVQLEAWVEDKMIRLWPSFQKSRARNVSKDPNVYIDSGAQIQHAARALVLLFTTILLLGPVVICNMVSTTSGRIVVVAASTVIFLIILSVLTKSKTMKLILLGATYATVIIGSVR
ncbi:hypothetical protein J3459_022263 [Metarhizium acridum]|uniref:uncharacterized protein n=1 Tax=Metarhizium acridum TaxID=92637 RepID=UPI001C6ABC55|nr:hypothetical protein J3459_022263 [Metarhizium acridum]KAG8412917.1 hypothetical protein J3458_013339 [Metarhizium acridum]